MAYIFVCRTTQTEYYAGNGQPGFGSLCLPGDVIHYNANTALTPPIPVNQNAFTVGSKTAAEMINTFSGIDLSAYSKVYWDCEYNPSSANQATAYLAGQELRNQVDLYNIAHSTNIKIYAYFHTPFLDYDPGSGAGAIATFVNGGTVGISQWQDPTDTQYITNSAPYVLMLKAKTIDGLGGVRLTIYYKGNPATLLTSAQLTAQFQRVVLPVLSGGVAADIIESYYGAPINPTYLYQPPLYDALNSTRTGTPPIGRSPAPNRAPAPARTPAS